MSDFKDLQRGAAPVQPITPAMVEQHFAGGSKKNRIRSMAEEIVRLHMELEILKANHQHVTAFLDYHGGPAVWEEDVLLEEQKRKVASEEEQAELVRRAADEYARTMQREADALRSMMPQLRMESALSAAALEDFAHPAQTYVELQNDLRENRDELKRSTAAGDAVECDENLPHSAAQQRRFTKNISKLALRCFNAEAENIVKSATASNMDTSINKLNRAADAIERLTNPLGCRISFSYQQLKAEELSLAVKVESARKIEREAERERRAELKEQARIDAELQAQRARLEKEKAHYESVLQRIEAAGDDDRALEIKQQLIEIEAGIADVDYRQANQRAGYVYVISNVGAFGERMVKIGMTRRLEPMDRVKELGDASVPFGFDVHALFFSEDAVDVESRLHQHFADQRVNMVNTRREFFYATPAEVREALGQIQGDLLEFVETPQAEQYRASMAMAGR